MPEPGGIVAATIGSPGPGWRPGSHWWLPGTYLVAPFSSVNSSSGHMVLTTTGGCGSGSG